MYSIELMVEEHDNILKFNEVVKQACLRGIRGEDLDVEDMTKMIAFGRNYADKHHHGKEEQLLFNEMVAHLGRIGQNLITHGMLVEHDLGRFHVGEWEGALNEYKADRNEESKLNIIVNAMAYTQLLIRHINKENEVVYTYAEKHLDPNLLKEIDEKVIAFENEAKELKIQSYYLNMLAELMAKYQ
ncbi:MAG: hemerythrin domain-containing protein [Lachnospiraceae bacterium]|nr:hemerythrin domain-containing protein [Lachnospiraceae bacterium]